MIDQLTDAVRTVPNFPKPGIDFKDITPILADPNLLRYAVASLAEPFETESIDRVIGIEARGFILGAMLAETLDVGFVPVRKPGKLPYSVHSESYDLEYGSDAVEMHTDGVLPGERVLIHDDVIATGGTAAAAGRLATLAGGFVVGYSFLVELDFLGGRVHLGDRAVIHSLLHY